MRPRTARSLRGPACTLCDILKLGYFPQVRLIVSAGIDLRCADDSKRTPLILCAFVKPEIWGLNLAMTLIEHGARVGERDNLGRNVLHHACIFERLDLVRLLLRAVDFDLDQMDVLGNTVLHYSAMSGNAAITELVVSAFKTFGYSFNKINRKGRTALQEAVRAGNTACARIIESQLTPGESVHSTKESQVHLPAPVNARSTQQSLGLKSSISSPRSRSDTSGSFAVQDGSSARRSRSNSSRHRSGFRRRTENPLYTNGYKHDEDVILAAPKNDFRNNPEYVFKLVNLTYDPGTSWGQLLDPTSINNNNTNSGRWTRPAQIQSTISPGWRHDLGLLFKVYEQQCSASWRVGRHLNPPAPSETASTGAEEDDRARRVRGAHTSVRGLHKESSPEPRRRGSSIRPRKMANNNKGAGGPWLEGSLDTSTESLNSLPPHRRRGGDPQGRLETLSSRQRVRSARALATPLSTTPMPTTPLPATLLPATLLPATLLPTTPLPDTPSLATPSSTNQRLPVKPTTPIPPKGTTNIMVPTFGSLVTNQTFPAANPEEYSDGFPNSVTQTKPFNETPHRTQRGFLQTSATSNRVSEDGPTRPQALSARLTLKGHVDSALPKIQVVKETPTAGHKLTNNSYHHKQVDTSKLWVQPPYDISSSDDEEDVYDIEQINSTCTD